MIYDYNSYKFIRKIIKFQDALKAVQQTFGTGGNGNEFDLLRTEAEVCKVHVYLLIMLQLLFPITPISKL